MKSGVFAIAAAIVGGVSARDAHAGRRHAHQAFHLGRNALVTGTGSPETCGCTTIYTTITGEGTLYNPPAPATTSAPAPSSSSVVSSASPSSVESTPSPIIVTLATSTATPVKPVPTPLASTVETPGVYTIPATTVVIKETTTVCGAASTSVPAGPLTYGGVTTVVETATTVVCPYATVSTNSGVVTSVIETTTYVCASAGTYTIAPSTTSLSVATTLVYPTPAVFTPGTYTRDAITTTIVETNYVIFCPLTASTEAPKSTAAPKPTSSAAPSIAEVPSSSYVAPVVSSTPVVIASSAPVVVSTPASSSKAVVVSSAAPSKSPSTSTGTLGSSGKQWAITYSPYTDSGSCKNAVEVAADILVIKAAGFEAVRIYSTDCSGLTNVGNACAVSGLRMIIGVFISSTGIAGAQTQVDAIVSWGKFSMVDLVVVGNEAVFNGFCTASALADFIKSSKAKFVAGGYSGKVTTTEPLNVWQSNTGALCGAVDVVGCNIHPFFNADVTAENAGPFTASQLKIVDGLCPGKTGINLETGWPSSGSCNGKACPGKDAQAKAIKSITESCGGQSVMFSYIDELWKPAGEFNCEQHWGAIKLF